MTLQNEQVYTPSELNREIKLHLEMGFPRVLIEAEISNLARPASGHLYFTLKAVSYTHLRAHETVTVIAFAVLC